MSLHEPWHFVYTPGLLHLMSLHEWATALISGRLLSVSHASCLNLTWLDLQNRLALAAKQLWIMSICAEWQGPLHAGDLGMSCK